MTVKKTSEWANKALCAGDPPDALFVRGAQQRSARLRCFQCPVRLECLADSLNAQVNYGVWGGLTERERRAVLRNYKDIGDWWAWLTESTDDLALELRGNKVPRVLARVR